MILGIDIGTTTGYALVDKQGVCKASGSKKFKSSDLGKRFLEAREFFAALLNITNLPPEEQVLIVYYERVRRFMSSQAALVYCGILAQLMTCCVERGITLEEFSPTEIKKFAVGKGKASKEEMIIAAEERTGSHLQLFGTDKE